MTDPKNPASRFGDKINTAGFNKNPQNRNTTGLNRKSFATVNNVLKAKGIQPLTKEQLIEFYTLIFNATEDELKRLSTDKKIPYMLRLVIGELNNKTTRSKALTDLREYMFVKAAQEITGNLTVKARVLAPEEIPSFLEGLKDKY